VRELEAFFQSAGRLHKILTKDPTVRFGPPFFSFLGIYVLRRDSIKTNAGD
jgi:hypothetical protein